LGLKENELEYVRWYEGLQHKQVLRGYGGIYGVSRLNGHLKAHGAIVIHQFFKWFDLGIHDQLFDWGPMLDATAGKTPLRSLGISVAL
jgi:hypothetical protein